jgi:hypothetical protein
MFSHAPAVSWSTHVRAMSSAFCTEVLTGSGHASMTASSHYFISSKTCAIQDTAAAICAMLNIWMTDRLISQVQPAGEHCIYNL